ncbi:hypothetical protein [Phytohabitans suffuscus]|uniref:hypothetical protein n=1 Tax=Phytohabitans suffuscus TaxID=624315 RepID=UPI001563B4B6|nr:hypothetical protein [Phytohabitans suffuscus]
MNSGYGKGLLGSSTTDAVSAHAHCPVVVEVGHHRPPTPAAVGPQPTLAATS